MDITGTWDQCRKHVYGLLDNLLDTVEKMQEFHDSDANASVTWNRSAKNANRQT